MVALVEGLGWMIAVDNGEIVTMTDGGEYR